MITFLGEIARAGGGSMGDLFPPTPAMLSACFSNSGKVITDILASYLRSSYAFSGNYSMTLFTV